MPGPRREGVKLFTVDEANDALPRVRGYLSKLKRIKQDIVASQARVDIEEMTAGGKKPLAKIEPLLKGIENGVHEFHKTMDELQGLGCELKDLEKGLVDFYSLRDEEIVFLCWMEGEERIQWWHPLETGFQGRQPL